MDGGDMLQFSRPMTMPDGAETVAGFKLAFACDLRSPDFFLFAVQRINALPADRSALEAHANGVTGISEIAVVAPDPEAFRAFVETASDGGEIEETSFGLSLAAGQARISLMTPEGLEAYFDSAVLSTDHGLRGSAILFAVADLAVTETHLAANGVTYTRKNNRILVKPAPGQGVLFAFEETR
jgi:hypothetical protein